MFWLNYVVFLISFMGNIKRLCRYFEFIYKLVRKSVCLKIYIVEKYEII